MKSAFFVSIKNYDDEEQLFLFKSYKNALNKLIVCLDKTFNYYDSDNNLLCYDSYIDYYNNMIEDDKDNDKYIDKDIIYYNKQFRFTTIDKSSIKIIKELLLKNDILTRKSYVKFLCENLESQTELYDLVHFFNNDYDSYDVLDYDINEFYFKD